MSPGVLFPYTLTAGQTEDARELKANFDAIQARLNGGVNDGDLVAGQTFSEAMLVAPQNALPRQILTASSTLTDSVTVGYYTMVDGGAGVRHGQPGAAEGYRFLHTTSVPSVALLRTEVAVQAFVYSNSRPALMTFGVGLFNVTAIAGAGASAAVSLGAPIASCTFNPPINLKGRLYESAFVPLPANTFAALGFYFNTQPDPISCVQARVDVNVRWVP